MRAKRRPVREKKILMIATHIVSGVTRAFLHSMPVRMAFNSYAVRGIMIQRNSSVTWLCPEKLRNTDPRAKLDLGRGGIE
jgi:hypothetical protein